MSIKAAFIMLTSLLMIPTFALADARIIINTPNYVRNNGSSTYYPGRDYARRHNFANPYQARNPYLNRTFSYDRLRQSRLNNNQLISNDRFNSLQRHRYGYQRRPIINNNQRFQRRSRAFSNGYQRGYRDAKRRYYGYR